MYVTTFYSFKGGVGRTMSLVNVGLELVKSGHRVLMVDFDLEAPGIETFDLQKPKGSSAGIVDYVSDYKATGVSPNVKNYLYESINEGYNGRLWIMPSGKHDKNYASKLNKINWDDLYKNDDGYLMMEDMKAQWKKSLNPNYVLIDSRTGHTDVGGICTRQLPDSVVILFVPNEQNLLGLEKVIPIIRSESKVSERKPIHLHFISSNVPDLDDESGILEKRMDGFKSALGYNKLSCTIHHYNHLSLLDQEIFTQTHPKSQLAKEYRELHHEIIKRNPEDREGVVSFIEDIITRPHSVFGEISSLALEERLTKICSLHIDDGEILAQVATYRFQSGKENDAFELLNQSIDTGYEIPDVLLRRAYIGHSLGYSDFSDDLKKVLFNCDSKYFEVNRAIELLKKISPSDVIIIPNAPAFKQLDPESRLDIAYNMRDKKIFLPVAKKIAEYPLINEDISEELKESFRAHLSLIELAMGEYSACMSLISDDRDNVFELGIDQIFNYAIAEWGKTKIPPRDLFELVIEFSKHNDDSADANYLQCMAVAYWGIGDVKTSLEMLDESEKKIRIRPIAEFSLWRYLTVTYSEFIDDLNDIRKMIKGENILPLFMREDSSLIKE